MDKANIFFYTEEVSFSLKNKKLIRVWITSTIRNEKKQPGDIGIVFCKDAFLLQMNQKFLGHNTYTDIITFDYSMQQTVNGEIYISVERVRENAKLFQTAFELEIKRVIIHGILHLCGYKDKTQSEKLKMRAKEDYYLSLLDKRQV